MSKENFQRMVSQISDLPSLPPVIPRLLAALDSPDASAREIEKILVNDPSLTAKVLKLINSAYYGLNRRIENVRDAVVYLGFNTVRNLAVGASVLTITRDKVSGDLKETDIDLVGLWEKSIATGIATETTGRRIRFPQAEDAMIGGLLHMLGTLILALYFRSELKEAVEYAHDKGCSLLAAEEEILGFRDPEMGRWLAESWDLPEAAIAGLGYYHEPFSAPPEVQMFPLLVYAGEKIVRAKGIGWTGDKIGVLVDDRVFKALEIDKDDFDVIVKEFQRDLDDAQEFMKLAQEL